MATKLAKSLAEFLFEVQVAIDLVLTDPERQARLAAYGYDAAALTAARAEYERAEALTQAQMRAYGAQMGATADYKAARARAEKAYKRSLTLARIVFREDVGATVALDLKGRRRQSLAGWMEQCSFFYEGLLARPERLAQMAVFGYDAAVVEAEKGLITAVQQANRAQDLAKGEAREATRVRDAQVDALARWLSDFRVVTKIALEEETP